MTDREPTLHTAAEQAPGREEIDDLEPRADESDAVTGWDSSPRLQTSCAGGTHFKDGHMV
jgi:hypothetical protein